MKTIKEINKAFDEKFPKVLKEIEKPIVNLSSMIGGGDKTVYGVSVSYRDISEPIKSFWNKQILSLIEELIGEDEEESDNDYSVTDMFRARNQLRAEMRASIKSYKKGL